MDVVYADTAGAIICEALWNKELVLGGCSRIESLLRKSLFWPAFPRYDRHEWWKCSFCRSKNLSASILGQPPKNREQLIFSRFSF